MLPDGDVVARLCVERMQDGKYVAFSETVPLGKIKVQGEELVPVLESLLRNFEREQSKETDKNFDHG